jgi:hypothetical protein
MASSMSPVLQKPNQEGDASQLLVRLEAERIALRRHFEEPGALQPSDVGH